MGHGGAGVGAHVAEEEPLADGEEGHGDVLADAVERVAGGPKDGAGDDGAGGELGRAGREEGARERVLVVKEDAVEAVVDAVVDVVEGLEDAAGGVVGEEAAAVDVRDERVGARDKVAPGLGDEARAGRELREHREQVRGDELERRRGLVDALEAAADVEHAHLEAVVLAHRKDGERVARGRRKRRRVRAAAAHVEAHAHHAHAQLRGRRQDPRHRPQRRAKLAAEAAQRVRVVRHNAQNHLRPGVVLRHLHQLVRVVKRHPAHPARPRVLNLRRHLARVRKHDPLRAHPHRRHPVNLVAARTVKARPQPVQQLQHRRVRVALHRIVRLHTRQRRPPPLVQLVHSLQVHKVERLVHLLLLHQLRRPGRQPQPLDPRRLLRLHTLQSLQHTLPKLQRVRLRQLGRHHWRWNLSVHSCLLFAVFCFK